MISYFIESKGGIKSGCPSPMGFDNEFNTDLFYSNNTYIVHLAAS